MTDISTFSAFTAELGSFIQDDLAQRGSTINTTAEFNFNRLALSLFRIQFAHNRHYRQFCEARKTVPQNTSNWQEISAMPAVGFKELELTSLAPEERTHVFHSSGTTTQSRSRHFHNRASLAICEASLLKWFAAHFPNARSTTFLILTPPPDNAPHSSLVHMFETLRHEFGSPQSSFAGKVRPDGTWESNFAEIIEALREAAMQKRPMTVMGTAFNFVHLLDRLAEINQRFHLPPGSCVLETGGYKSQSRAMAKPDLHALITKLLDIPVTHIVCEYGMSELSSQAYDTIAGNVQPGARIFQFPPWARAQIINPETGREAGEGETGLIRIFDLANVYSVMAVQTEDLGVRRSGGFELLGRAAQAELRGCSLMSA